ncbi:hypothetical protein [Numidum massiliense]|uniref:hypothetical protein n=1 Tax=Numidum massiliense TaxID=1522315 RepID=UPI0006D588DB|nr:hypothetical protein [Numidum massiliense]
MKVNIRLWAKKGLIYVIAIALTIVAVHLYQERETNKYIHTYKRAGGDKVLSDISDTYKSVIEHYSNYKLSRETKARMIKRLEKLRGELEEVDRQINRRRPIAHKINFTYVFHDMKLVRLSLSDTTKDDIVPVIVLHANEGLKELEKEITYIEFR